MAEHIADGRGEGNVAGVTSDNRLMTDNLPSGDYLTEVGKGNIPGHTFLHKFGENPDIDITSGFEDITDIGGKYNFLSPASPETHNIASDSAEDAGTVLSSGTATGGSTITLVDSSATFVSDGVSAGDSLLNDNSTVQIQFGTVVNVNSETTLTVVMVDPNSGLSGQGNSSGDTYRVVTSNGTGAAITHILGHIAALVESEEFVVNNGLSNVATSQSYAIIYRMRIFNTGSSDGGVGTIAATAAVSATISAQVVNGNNQTLMSVYRVPSGKIAFLQKWWGSISAKKSGFSVMHIRAGSGVGSPSAMYLLQTRGLNTEGTSTFEHKWDIPPPIPEGIDILIEADSSVNDLGISGGFDLLLVDSDLV